MKTATLLAASLIIFLAGCSSEQAHYSPSEMEEFSSPQPTLSASPTASPISQENYAPDSLAESSTLIPASVSQPTGIAETEYIPPAIAAAAPIYQATPTPLLQVAPKPDLAAISPAAREVLQPYTHEELISIANQVTSDDGCSVNAVQTYYGGSLDYCKAFQGIMEPHLRRGNAINNQLGGHLNNIRTEEYHRQSIQTDENFVQDAQRRSFAPGN
jgi:hypothetical protein